MKNFAIFYPEGHQTHVEAGHPERPERVDVICQALKNAGLWANALHVVPEPVSPSFLERIHSPAYLSLLERVSQRGGHLDSDTYVTTSSWRLALSAAGGAIALAKSVWNREARSGLALTRPPGHHAMRGQGMGFCLLNNVALAAEALLQNSNAKQLAIVDLDLHHGNGTQDIFWQRGEVMYISTHQRPLFPGTGSLDEVGQGAGYKTTANFPLPPGSGDEAFRVIMDQAILPLLQRYKPEMVLVSYGFDTHWSDPLGFLCLTADGYAKIISSLRDYTENECSGRIAVFLEGGYNLEAAEVCTVGIVNALLGQDWEDPLGPSPYSATRTWLEMFQQARAFWDL